MSDFASVKELIEDVPGWLSDEEGEALFELARECTGKGVIVEIGSWKGKSTICLGLGSRAGNGVRIFAVDPHADYRHGEFKQNIERAGIADLVTPVKGLSQEMADGFEEPIELLFVDGSHEEDLVREDFDKWVPKVVEGGVVAFHDTTWHPGVRRVVAEKIYGSRGFSDVRFVIGSTTVARKVASNTARDRLHARRVQATKRVFGTVTSVVKRKRGWLPGPVERAGRRVFKLVGK